MEKEDEPKQEGSRRARLKIKMRKLVRKKLCKSRKKGSGLESVVPGFGSEVPESTEGDICIKRDGVNELKQIDGHGELNQYKFNISQISSDPCELILSKEGSVGGIESGTETSEALYSLIPIRPLHDTDHCTINPTRALAMNYSMVQRTSWDSLRRNDVESSPRRSDFAMISRINDRITKFIQA
ncbi:hypothetical protein POM88_019648 [Heracleum sosnowskyi]|uniref:Uncharacterized protein n=1 Tax=Heracleum sosnowskyi TaxID=360622 RepID=A0AAD8ICK2_9APIA|nr:hypothetical protein POM88_019648 [Heracleum sosnowskyi]